MNPDGESKTLWLRLTIPQILKIYAKFSESLVRGPPLPYFESCIIIIEPIIQASAENTTLFFFLALGLIASIGNDPRAPN